MSAFSIAVYTAAGRSVLVPGALEVEPQQWSAEAVGGPWDAEVLLRGALEELAGLTAWLGYRLEIYNGNGTPVWWGDIAAVEIVAEGLRRGVSLDRMANRVQVRYAQRQPGGVTIAADTAWADDAISQGAYGIGERRISPQRSMSAGEATAYRTTALGVLAEPYYTLNIDDGAGAAVLRCTGFWQRMKRVYYRNAAGLVQNAPSGKAAPLGLGFTSADVAFVARDDSVHSLAGWLGNFDAGMRVKISGAAQAGNNGAWTVSAGGDTRPNTVYTSTAVTFSPNDDIADANSGLSFLAQDDVFLISGTDLNNGTWLVDKAGAAAIEVNGSHHGSLVTSESAGDTVQFTRGNRIKVTGSLTNELRGNTVTVTAWGQRHYQTFTLPVSGAWTAAAIELRLRRVGGPSDSITVQLVSDSAGAPGSVLDSATVAADNIPTDTGWVSFVLANTVTLTFGSTYGIVVLRTGSNHYANYYEIDTDEGATYTGGALKLYDGAAWQTPDPALDLVFRVLGGVDTGAQAATAMRAAGWADVSETASGIVANQYRDGETRAIDEAAALLDMGTSGGARLLVRTLRNLTAVISARPTRAAVSPRFVYRGGRLLDRHGQATEDGLLPAGEWVTVGDADTLGPWGRLSPIFAERAEYRAGGGLTIEPEGQADMFDTGVAQG